MIAWVWSQQKPYFEASHRIVSQTICIISNKSPIRIFFCSSLSHKRAMHESLLALEKNGEGKYLLNFNWLFKIVETSGPFQVFNQRILICKSKIFSSYLLRFVPSLIFFFACVYLIFDHKNYLLITFLNNNNYYFKYLIIKL